MQASVQMYLDSAHRLQQEAQQLIEQTGIEKKLEKYGNVTRLGSFALNLMVWPDIDLYLTPTEWPLSSEKLAMLAAELLTIDNILQFKIETALFHERPFLPKGTYVGLKLNEGNWKLPWKFDIWILEKAYVDKKIEWLMQTQANLTASNIPLILTEKHRLITAKGRTPSFSSYYLYQAILEKGLTEPQDIRNYLLSHQIILPDTDFSQTPWK